VGAGFVNAISFNGSGLPRPVPLRPQDISGTDHSYLCIPTTLPKLRTADPELALEWRLCVRQHMQQLFTRGFVGLDFGIVRNLPEPVGVYVFERVEE
jgi:predicted GNAT superfamily acetyltransferase